MSEATGVDTAAAFLHELAAVIGAVLEAPAAVQPVAEAATNGWTVTLEASQGASGSLVLFVDRAGTDAVAKHATGQATEPTGEEIGRTLTEWCADAATAFVQRPPFAGARIVVGRVEEAAAPDPSSANFQLTAGSFTIYAAIAGRISGAADRQADAAGSADAGRRPAGSQTFDAILDIDLPLVVRFGRTEMTLKALTALGPGSLIDLGRSPDDPVDVLVSNQLVARGEVVIVGGSYGVRITDVTTPGDRTRSMEERLQ